MALGGSTNVVLHLLAIAHEAEVELTLDDFNRIGDKVPHVGDLKPFGKYVMNDVDRHGGLPVLMKALLDAGLHARRRAHRHRQDDGREPRRARTPTRSTASASARSTTRSTRPAASRSCTGSFAPEGAVVKTAGFDADVFEGPARVFERERAAMDALDRRRDRRRRRRRHPLRGPQGRPRHARDARDHRRHQGRGARKRCTTLDGRQILRRHNRPVHRPHSTRSGGRRSHRLRARW